MPLTSRDTATIRRAQRRSTLTKLEPELRQNALLTKDKVISGATFDDAITLAHDAGLQPNTVGYNDFITEAMQ